MTCAVAFQLQGGYKKLGTLTAHMAHKEVVCEPPSPLAEIMTHDSQNNSVYVSQNASDKAGE